MLDRLAKMFPAVRQERLSELSDVWSLERDAIIRRMLKICGDENGHVMASVARPEAIFQLARFGIWLEERIISTKLQAQAIEQIDPADERLRLELPFTADRIENTARLCADRIWKPLLDEWHRRFPLVSIEQPRGRKFSRGHTVPGVKTQHYSPSFSNAFWAVGPQRLVRIYSLRSDGGILSVCRGYKAWGREAFLYSQELERMFQLVESDAQGAYAKLLQTIPLNEKERRCWIAFLLAQMVRTPSFMLRHLAALKRYIETNEVPFSVETGSLRRAYETLFSNDDFYAAFYGLITARRWELWSAPSDRQFIRGDNPAIVRGSTQAGTWQLIYPLTPGTCFVAGPDAVVDPTSVVPAARELSEAQVRTVNRWTAEQARTSVIAQPAGDDSDLRAVLEDALGRSSVTGDWRHQVFPKFWGPIR